MIDPLRGLLSFTVFELAKPPAYRIISSVFVHISSCCVPCVFWGCKKEAHFISRPVTESGFRFYVYCVTFGLLLHAWFHYCAKHLPGKNVAEMTFSRHRTLTQSVFVLCCRDAGICCVCCLRNLSLYLLSATSAPWLLSMLFIMWVRPHWPVCRLLVYRCI